MAEDEKTRVRAMTQPAQAQQPLWRRYEEPDDRGLIDAVCEEVRLLAEHGTQDPGQTIALAVAGAEAAEGLTAALEDPWALYTPQQVAVTASALFTQITAAGTALEKLDRLLDVMAERGDIPEPDHDGVGEAERLCTAQSTLGAAGQEAVGAIDVRACEEAVHPHLHALHRDDAHQHPRDSHSAGRPARRQRHPHPRLPSAPWHALCPPGLSGRLRLPHRTSQPRQCRLDTATFGRSLVPHAPGQPSRRRQ
ncbi:hypothetical protein ACPC37_33390 [Streptomyces griseoincarnatus]